MKNVIIVILAIIAVVAIAIICVGAHFVVKSDYAVIEHYDGSKTIVIRPVTVSKDNKTVYYLPASEEIQLYSINVGRPMNIENIFWMNN